MKTISSLLKNKHIQILIGLSFFIVFSILLYEYKFTGGNLGSPLDDVFIHFQFSKNIANGNGFAFNANDPTPGSTSPLWTVLISIFYFFIKNHLFIAKSLSALFYVLTGITTYLLGSRILKSKKLALIASIFTVITGRFAWAALSGMEVTFFTFILCLTIYLHLKKRSKLLIAFMLGIASIIRPEAYLFSLFFFIIEFFSWIKSKRSPKSLKQLFTSGLIYLLIISPYLMFSYYTTGSFLPNTFAAQSISDSTLSFKFKMAGLYLFRYAYLLFTDNPIIAISLVFSFISFKDRVKKNYRYLFLLAILIGFPLFASISAPNLRHHGRYTMPLIPLYTIFGIEGLRSLLNKINTKKIKLRILPQYTALVMINIYLLIMLLNWANTYVWNVKNINDMHVKLGKWIDGNTQEDSLLAINDIGAITYYSDRQIIDMIGLVSPDTLDVTEGLSKSEREEPLWDYINAEEADYLIILPCWYPEMAQREELREVYSINLDRYTIIDCEMKVYEIQDNPTDELIESMFGPAK